MVFKYLRLIKLLCLFFSWNDDIVRAYSVLPLSTIQHVSPMVETRSFSNILLQTETMKISSGAQDLLMGIQNFLIAPAYAAEAYKAPTNSEIQLLGKDFDVVYGERNPEKAIDLLTETINVWESKAPDERAALFRVRADCYLDTRRYDEAVKDYTVALQLLDGPGGELAEPTEKPTVRLGRARALRSMGRIPKDQFEQAAQDYQLSFRLPSRKDWDTNW